MGLKLPLTYLLVCGHTISALFNLKIQPWIFQPQVQGLRVFKSPWLKCPAIVRFLDAIILNLIWKKNLKINNLPSLVFPSDSSYGTKMDNGSQFSGILGLLQNQVQTNLELRKFLGVNKIFLKSRFFLKYLKHRKTLCQ